MTRRRKEEPGGLRTLIRRFLWSTACGISSYFVSLCGLASWLFLIEGQTLLAVAYIVLTGCWCGVLIRAVTLSAS